jgi:hypothetical protein
MSNVLFVIVTKVFFKCNQAVSKTLIKYLNDQNTIPIEILQKLKL